MAKPVLTESQRAERRARQRELVTQSVQALQSSDGWRRWLRTRRAFRTYSLHNQLLIACQHENATRVAGFRAWLKLGYCVRRGEKAIRIWAPCPPSKRQLAAWRAAGAVPEERPRTCFRLTAVFAQDQVDPMPPPAQPVALDSEIVVARVEGDSHGEFFARLTDLARDIGYTIVVAPTGPADGYCDRRTREIILDVGLEPNGRVLTAIHELAHALIGEQTTTTQLSRAEEEVVVESVAYCACQSVGLATDANSIPYLAGWAEHADLDVLRRAAGLCDQLATRIEDALADHDDPPTSEVALGPTVAAVAAPIPMSMEG